MNNTIIENNQKIVESYYINMHTMGFSRHEATIHYRNMHKDYPTAKPREICWLVQNYAQKRASSPLRISNAYID